MLHINSPLRYSMSANKRGDAKESSKIEYALVVVVAGGAGASVGGGCWQVGSVRIGRREVSAGGGCWRVGSVSRRRVFMCFRHGSVLGMVIVTSIDRKRAQDDGRELIDFSVNLFHSNLFPIFNPYRLIPVTVVTQGPCVYNIVHIRSDRAEIG